MTVDWIQYAQSLTAKPVKGMLTGPITMLMWSFVRDDQPRSTTALQLALAIRDEVADLERAGIGIIQIDEPAFREGLPLKKADWNPISEVGGGSIPRIQLQCKGRYADTYPYVLLGVQRYPASDRRHGCGRYHYRDLAFTDGIAGRVRSVQVPNEIGPGVYDIHSPRIPETEEILELLEKAYKVINPMQFGLTPLWS